MWLLYIYVLDILKTKWYLSSKAFILYDKQILFSLATFWYLPVSTFSLSLSLRCLVKRCTLMWKSRYFSMQNSNWYCLYILSLWHSSDPENHDCKNRSFTYLNSFKWNSTCRTYFFGFCFSNITKFKFFSSFIVKFCLSLHFIETVSNWNT